MRGRRIAPQVPAGTAAAVKIHLRQIPEEGLHLETEEPADFLDVPAGEHVRPEGPVRYSLDVGMSGDSLWATGELSLDVELQCVRCLEAFSYPLHIGDVALQVETPATETVDLTPELREDILLALPAHPHCDWSGERVCPGRVEAPEEAAGLGSSAGGPSQAPSAWEKLDQLRTPSN